MMKCDSLFEEFKKFEGQPVEIFTDDGKMYCGIDLAAFADYVRILDDCGRTIFIDYTHIDAVVEPQMKLRRCCRDQCDCDRDNDRDHDRDRDRDHDNGDSYGNSDSRYDCR